METKQAIRQVQLQKRREMTEADFWKKSEQIARHLTGLDPFCQATEVYLFASFGREPDTWRIMEDCLTQGKRVWLPKIAGKEMDFFSYEKKECLIRNRFGMLEPDGTEKKGTGKTGMIIVPALAVDKEGYRVGYGGGYYDRYLKEHKTLYKAGIVFSCQLLKKAPRCKYDIPLDCVITEEGMFRFHR